MKNESSVFTKNELERIFHYLDESIMETKTIYQYQVRVRNRAMIAIMYYGAMSPEEIITILCNDYDPETKKLLCPVSSGKKGWNNIDIRIMDKKIRKDLEYHLEVNKPEKFLFENIRTDQGMTVNAINEIVYYVCSHAAISEKKSCCRTFQETMIQQFLDGSVNSFVEDGFLKITADKGGRVQ